VKVKEYVVAQCFVMEIEKRKSPAVFVLKIIVLSLHQPFVAKESHNAFALILVVLFHVMKMSHVL
jgi:hypothetical protein